LHPGTIDMSRFNGDILEKNIDYGKEYAAARLVLSNLDNNGANEVYYHKESYENWLPFTFDKTKFLKLDKQIYANIWNGTDFNKGRLQIEIITFTG